MVNVNLLKEVRDIINQNIKLDMRPNAGQLTLSLTVCGHDYFVDLNEKDLTVKDPMAVIQAAWGSLLMEFEKDLDAGVDARKSRIITL